MFKLLPLLILISQFFYTSPSYSSSSKHEQLFSEISALTDESGEKTLAEIIEMDGEFKKITPPFSGGFTQAANWFRIVIQRTEDAPIEWVLSATPAYLNDINFYSANNKNHYTMQQAGDLFSSELRPLDKLYGAYSFVLNITDTLPHVYFLRLQTRSTSTLNISILSTTDSIKHNIKKKMLLCILLGGLSFIFIQTTLMWKQTQHKSYIAFLGYILISIFVLLIMDGTWQQYLIPDYPELFTYTPQLMMWGLLFFINLFFILFFDTSKNFPIFHKVFCGVLVLATLNFLSAPLGYYTIITPLVVATNLFVAIPMQLYVSWRSKHHLIEGSLSIFYGVMLYYISYGGMLLTALGVFSISAISIINFQIFFLVFLLFIGLQQHFKSLIKFKQEGVMRLQTAEKIAKIESQQSKDKSTFLNLVAHEIKTPLAVIDSAIQILETQQDLDVMVRKRHHRIRSSVSNLTDLLDNTFLSERTKEAPLQPKKELCELRSIVEHLIQAKFAGDYFHLEIADNLQCVADVTLLNLALSNLFGNALKFSPNKSKITVVAEKIMKQNKDGVIISVSNNYIAEHKPETSQWFTKYYQAKTSSNQEGLGLGLYMVKKIVETHGGVFKCSIEPREHQWKVTVQLWLPEIKEVSEK